MLDFASSCDALANSMSSEDEHARRGGRSSTWAVEEGAASGEDSDREQGHQSSEIPRPAQRTMDGIELPITAAEKTRAQRAHTNFGHPPNDHFSGVLRAARVKPHIMRYVQTEFSGSDLFGRAPHILGPARRVGRPFLVCSSLTGSSASTLFR